MIQLLSSFRTLTAILLCVVACASAQAADAPPVDAEIEQRLDSYLRLAGEDLEAAEQAITAIMDDLSEQTPAATWVRALGYQAGHIYIDQPEAAGDLLDQLLAVAQADGSPATLAEALSFKAQAYSIRGEITEALALVPTIEPLLAETASPRIRYFGHNLLARLLRFNGQYEGALEHFLAAYDAVSETDDERTLLRRQFLNYSIAHLQADLRNYSAAMDMVERTIHQAEEHGLTSDLPSLFLLKGYIEGETGQSEASIESQEKAIYWARQLDQPGVVVVSLNNIASTYAEMERYEDALEVYREALNHAEDGEDLTTDLIRFNMAYARVMLGQHEQIAEMEQHVETLRERYNQAEFSGLLRYVAQAYQEAGLQQRAIDALQEKIALDEEVFQAERDRSLSELQTRYEAKEQATQIELLEQRNALQERLIENARLRQRIVVLFVLVVMMAVVLLALAFRAARRANQRLKHANRQLKFQSSHDPLTGLLNRRSFQNEMNKRSVYGGERRQQHHPDAILLLDVDYFKKINDNRGHAAGDAVLVELAERLKLASRATDLVIRWGGEEVLLFLRNIDPEMLPEFAGRVLDYVGSEPVEVDGESIHVTATGGFLPLPFANLDEGELGWERALQIADMALYIGKTQGRNRAIGVLDLNVSYEQARESLERDLAKAIEQGWVKSVTVRGPGRAEPD